jgi:flavin reductase (DIM6/NTAB) family NADH-FMN oxidoreductase RutF
MDPEKKKTALRMIPYGIYVLTAKAPDGAVAAATVNFVTQTSFNPPLVAVGVKADSSAREVVGKAGAFALNILGKGQQGAAFAFFKPVTPEGSKLGPEPFTTGAGGAPLLDNAPAVLECKVLQIVEQGDHHIVVGEVIGADLRKQPEGRPDDAVLAMRDLGEKVFYGG